MLLTLREVATRLRVSLNTARAIVTMDIPRVRVGRGLRVREEDLNRYITRNTLKPIG
jgi:excisionase family DNA binding protein